MKATTKQKFEPGTVVKIELTRNRLAFARVLPGVASMICVYDFIAYKTNQIPDVGQIINQPVLFCCSIYRTIITKGIFEKVGYMPLTENEIASLPPSFTQNFVDISKCVIFWILGGERSASPQECIGLERSSVWDENGLIERIEDHYAGKKNFGVEHQKVILSKDDPRYLPPPDALRWNFDKQEFYRIDK